MDKLSISVLSRINLWQLVIAIIIVSVVVLFLSLFFELRWETNDDIGMSMVAHGYGLASVGLPNLIFSNILWGYIVRAIPEINSILGYSIATLSVLTIVGTVILYTTYKLGAGYFVSLAVFILLIVRPVLFPQFTINSGLLLISAILCWHLFAKSNNLWALLIGCLLAFLSYLVRSQEFLLVLLVAMPLMPWKKILQDQVSKIALLLLMVSILSAVVIDYKSYQADEWNAFNELNIARAPYTDFGIVSRLKQRPDVLQRYGYSINDIGLIRNWFFVDPQIANPKKLQAMLNELDFLSNKENAYSKVWLGIQALWHPKLLPLLITALLFAIISPSWKILISWLLCISAIIAMGLIGRPGVIRVYIPVLSLLVIAPFLVCQTFKWKNKYSVIISALIVFLTSGFNTYSVLSESRILQNRAEQARKELSSFPNETVVLWGGSFPYEVVYPVLSPNLISYKFYALGVFTLAPFSLAYTEERKNRGMTERLLSKDGIPIVANNSRFEKLAIYCKEHYRGELVELSSYKYGKVTVSWRQCKIN